MYIPSQFDVDDIVVIREFIKNNAFGAIFSQYTDNSEISYLPFMLDSAGKSDVLISHFAKPNKHWELVDGKKSLISFLGPHTYISHRDYGNVVAVPTWNYAVVNAYCTGRLITEQENRDGIVTLLQQYEGKNHGIADELIDKIVPATVGAVFEVERYECKFKFSQNRKPDEFTSMLDKLAERSDAQSKGVLDFVRNNMSQISKKN